MVDTKLSRLSMTSTLPASWRAVISLLEEGVGKSETLNCHLKHVSKHMLLLVCAASRGELGTSPFPNTQFSVWEGQ